jgi:putative hydrolase of the HAD superfamily
MPQIKTIAFDGDDTLWHHENFLTEAHDYFNDLMYTYGVPKDVAQKSVDDLHIADIGIFGYGVKSIILAMIEMALELTHNQVSANDLRALLMMCKKLSTHPINLLDGVAETVEKLSGNYRLMVITKGDLVAQEYKVAQSGLRKHFKHIEIIAEKNVATYQRIFDEHHLNPAEVLMIGNSIKSDIIPILQLGAQAIHIPYHTTWKGEQGNLAELAETDKGRFVLLATMANVPSLLEKAAQNPHKFLSELI